MIKKNKSFKKIINNKHLKINKIMLSKEKK